MASFYVKVRLKEGQFREAELGPDQTMEIKDGVRELATIQTLGAGLTQDIEVRLHESSQKIRVARPGEKPLPPRGSTKRDEDFIERFGWPQPKAKVRFHSGLFRESRITAVNVTDKDGLVAGVVWRDE